MAGLPSDFGEWSLDSDKKLLASLQQFSASFLSRLHDVELSFNQLQRNCEEAEIRATHVNNRFRLLAHTHFVEQGLKDTEEERVASKRRPATPTPVHLTPENFDQVVHPKYLEALRIGAEAVAAAEAAPQRELPLPHIFGSPEYLQDPHGGLGPLLPGWQPPAPPLGDPAPGAVVEWGGPGISSAAPSTMGDLDADDFSTVEGGSEYAGIHRLPDFKSMLEAALRGDVGDDSASMTHSVQRSSGSHDGHSAYVAGLESISEALMQNEAADQSSSATASLQHRRNTDVEKALHVGLDVGREHGGSAVPGDGGDNATISLAPDFIRTVSQAIGSAAAEPAPQPWDPSPVPEGSRSPQRGPSKEAPRPASTPLSEELLSRHSASLDAGGGGLNGSASAAVHQQISGALEQLQQGNGALKLPGGSAGGLFDEDEAAEYVDSPEEFHSPEQQLRISPQKRDQ